MLSFNNCIYFLLFACLSSILSTPINAKSLHNGQLQFPIPNPFGQNFDDDSFYLVESIHEIYQRSSSAFTRKQVSEYFNLKNGNYFSYHTNINDFKPIGEPYAYITNINDSNNIMYHVRNPNGYPQFECEIDQSNETRLDPWSYEWALDGQEKSIKGHIYGISALWLSAIKENLLSTNIQRDPENWSEMCNLWLKDEEYYKYEIGFPKPIQMPDMDDAELAEAVSKTILSLGKVTEFSDARDVVNRQYRTYRYFWIQKFLVKVKPSQDFLLEELLRAKEKCIAQ